MASLQKIDEWIKEAEDRPGSALVILRLIANRLHELSERNEHLLSENIALQDGSRVEQYQARIGHLEFQLEMLKRRFGEQALLEAEASQETAASRATNLLLYHAHGRIIRLDAPDRTDPANPLELLQLAGEIAPANELPRFLSVLANDELLLLFSSGRIATCPVGQIQAVTGGASVAWSQAALPEEPHGGELLSALIPLSTLPLSDYFVQVSRRGCVKKTMLSMAETILSNRFIGRGTLQRADQPFELLLCTKKARLVLVTYEGRLLGLDVDDLTYSAEQRLKLEPHDHVVAAFALAPGKAFLCLTQTGKVIYREGNLVEPARSTSGHGQPLISPARLEQGTRFIGAVPVAEPDMAAVLDARGKLQLWSCRELKGRGALPDEGLLLAMGLVPGLPAQAGT